MAGLAAEVGHVDGGDRVGGLDQKALARGHADQGFRALRTGNGQARPRTSRPTSWDQSASVMGWSP